MSSTREGRRERSSPRFGRKVYTFQTIDSTNNCARALAGCWAEEGTVVIAEEQTAGKGRLGRSWLAAPGENLTFSIVLRPDLPSEEMNLLPLFVAVGVAAAVESVISMSIQCKWPNDLLLNGKKFAGVLMEGSVSNNAVEYVIVGIGINVNQTLFPPELTERATSLRLATGGPIDRDTLFRAILHSLETEYDSLLASGFHQVLPRWLSYAPIVGRKVTIGQDGSVLTGTVRGISKHGGLILETDGEERVVFAGDVTILNMEPYAARN
jgi:BirA family transcriptional regulator, biotin operon repressor / biotin---[acetyl-CoA-carboxylase] ligase